MTTELNPISKINLTLSRYPVEEINSIIEEFGKFAVVVCVKQFQYTN